VDFLFLYFYGHCLKVSFIVIACERVNLFCGRKQSGFEDMR